MISSINGTLESIGINHVIVRVAGVGLQVYVPNTFTDTLGPVGEQVNLYTTLLVRDDSLTLYGFPTLDGKRLFDFLLGVSGVGPRHALGMLSTMAPNEVAIAIVSGNVDVLSTVPGIGKRTAGRLIVDLQAKLQREWEAIDVALSDSRGDAAAALQALGYSTSEVQKAISKLIDSRELSLEDQVRLALREISKG